MPAGLPGDSLFNNQGNPNAGNFVIFDPLSGPKDAPLDAKLIDYSTGSPPGWDATERIPILINDDSNISTGALSTGIGIGGEQIINIPAAPLLGPATAPGAIWRAGFNDYMEPGKQPLTYGAGGPPPVWATMEIDSTMMYIGGGRSELEAGDGADGNGAPANWTVSVPDPYTEGIAICGAGNGGSRDSGANTGFALKMVTATGDVANGAAVEAGFVNRSGAAMVSGQSVFGSASVALDAAA
jgi:hypothetical protein